MIYSKYAWQDDAAGNTPITASRLNNMEAGIEAAHNIPGDITVKQKINSTSSNDAWDVQNRLPNRHYRWFCAYNANHTPLASQGALPGDEMITVDGTAVIA